MEGLEVGFGKPAHNRQAFSFTGDGRLLHNLYINGQEREQNVRTFGMLKDQRGVLEKAYGRSLVFEKELPRSSKGSCSIGAYRAGDVTERKSHGKLIEWLLDAGVRLRRAIHSVDLLEESCHRRRIACRPATTLQTTKSSAPCQPPDKSGGLRGRDGA